MKQKNIFKLIRTVEQMNNENIMQFTKKFQHPLGISPILVLAELRTKGPQKQAELAETIGYTKGAMTNISEKLVRLGFAERLYDESDRRTIQLQITTAGMNALKEAQAIGEDVFMLLFESLSEEEINQYLMIQEKIVQGIESRKKK
ncbi:MarR family winged helix-turn-helix transcriptional regulator [Sporosarcina siberiensis]|uniref:MarR family winged helix-turn-helix transcriptional regulator n=1 Tax=Sporosarcina siberiensis TaxID=1365606 RepID=A0ABW4SHH0_9BACL